MPDDPSLTDPFLGVPAAAAWLGVTPHDLSNWRRRNYGPAYFKPAGKKSRVLYRLSALKAYVAQSTVEITRSPPRSSRRPWQATPGGKATHAVGHDVVHRRLVAAVDMAGGITAWARAHGISHAPASQMYHGTKAISAPVARSLGYLAVGLFEPIEAPLAEGEPALPRTAIKLKASAGRPPGPVPKRERSLRRASADIVENQAEILAALQRGCDAAGGPYAWAKEHAFHGQRIVAVLHGFEIAGPRLAAALGFRYVVRVRYERIVTDPDERIVTDPDERIEPPTAP